MHGQGLYFDALEKLTAATDQFNTCEQPSQNLKTKLPEVYTMMKECYLLTASCYVCMGNQQDNAMTCINTILAVEPEDPEALYLRAQSYESRMETALLALKDYWRTNELCSGMADKRKAAWIQKQIREKLARINP